MFGINGTMRLYYVSGIQDMRCGYYRLCEIVKSKLHRDPYNGDVYMFMSKDRRKVKLIRYENSAYYLYEKSFTNGLRFMRIEADNTTGTLSYKLDWKSFVAILECPVRGNIRLS